MRECTKCHGSKPIEDFTIRADRNGNAWGWWCKDCTKTYRQEYAQRPEQKEKARARAKTRQADRRAYERRPDRKRVAWEKRLMREYGIDAEDLARLYEAQGGCCAGCCEQLKFDSRTAIDHCHASGRVRGLLCTDCNQALGFLRDNPATMHRLIDYLRPREVLTWLA